MKRKIDIKKNCLKNEDQNKHGALRGCPPLVVTIKQSE